MSNNSDELYLQTTMCKKHSISLIHNKLHKICCFTTPTPSNRIWKITTCTRNSYQQVLNLAGSFQPPVDTCSTARCLRHAPGAAEGSPSGLPNLSPAARRVRRSPEKRALQRSGREGGPGERPFSGVKKVQKAQRKRRGEGRRYFIRSRKTRRRIWQSGSEVSRLGWDSNHTGWRFTAWYAVNSFDQCLCGNNAYKIDLTSSVSG